MRRDYEPEQPSLSGRSGDRRVPRLDGALGPGARGAAIIEPKVTGPTGMSPVRIHFKNNINLAKEHLGYAKKQLGGMRMMYDVGDRVEHGEEGMYWLRRVQLGDGTVVTTSFNERLQEIVIDSPHQGGPVTEEKPTSQPKKHPYLWVGMKYNFAATGVSGCDELWDALWTVSMVVEEPGANGIVWDFGSTAWSLRNSCTSYPGTHLWPSECEFNAQDQIDYANGYFDDANGNPCFMAGLPNGWDETRLAFELSESNNDPYVNTALRFTRNGGRMYDVRGGASSHDQAATEFVLGPHDPLDPDLEIAGYPPADCHVYSGGYSAGMPYADNTPWVSVFVVDPSEGRMLLNQDGTPSGENRPTSHRAGDVEVLNFILDTFERSREDMLVVDEEGEGKYSIKLFGLGNCSCDGMLPTSVDIEVRSGKEPDMQVYRTTIVIDSYSYDVCSTWPFGNGGPFCVSGSNQATGNGPGTMCSNWWPGAILADVWGNIEEVDYYQPDYLPGGGNCTNNDCYKSNNLFYVAWCGYRSRTNWMENWGDCSDVADCIGEYIEPAVQWLIAQTGEGADCHHDSYVDADRAALAAGWQGIAGILDPDDYFAALYDPHTGTWSPAPSGCTHTCWIEGSGDGCWEAYLQDRIIVVDDTYVIVESPMVPGYYCWYEWHACWWEVV